MQNPEKNIAGSTREKIEAIVRKRFLEMPEEKTCRFIREDFEPPEDPTDDKKIHTVRKEII